ncbi:endonuclease [Persicobacter sp. CCB-QB2]|uniref:endonuclease n=1 Tax=Persicobacter sp. CCB-QB2 TaxID=1561025 RepID=UPI001C128A6C|nr:endonuclease [Persicobacter sp. CCB-QB2]
MNFNPYKFYCQAVVFLMVIFTITSCVDSTFENPSKEVGNPIPPNTATISIAGLIAEYAPSSNNMINEIDSGTVIVGQVISSDQAGNIYKEVYLQDETAGILMRLDASALYNEYPIGMEIAVDCSQLVMGAYETNPQLGIPSIYNNQPSAGRIPAPLANEYITKGATKELEVTTVSLAQIFGNIDAYAGKWVKIENMSVAEADRGKTFANAEEQISQNRKFNDGTGLADIEMRTSGYADFAGQKLPAGTGTVYGILSKFRGGPQLYINSSSDLVGFDGDNGSGGEGEIYFQENFDNWQDGQVAAEGWSNITAAGTVSWVKESSAGHYVAFSPFRSGDASSEGWLVLPEVEGANMFLEFRMAVGFMVDGHTEVMKVMVSEDFAGDVNAAQWVDFTDQVTFPEDIGKSEGKFWQWKGSSIDLSQFSGGVHIAFVYYGSDANSTKLELDNIVVRAGASEGDGGNTPTPGPDNYYRDAADKSGYELKTTLYHIINYQTEQLTYGELWTAYESTDLRDGNIVWDMYSHNPSGTQPYEYTFQTDQCGNTPGHEGGCYNREHSFPKSWFGGTVYPMYTDLVSVVPVDSHVNTIRSNYPYGEVANPNYTSDNGGKRGANTTSGYSGTVFEPIDEYKGDFARIYFYMATRYEDEIASWENNSTQSDAVLDGSSDKVFEDWQLELLLKWHENDPVSQKEIDRNEAVYTIQKNRNPYVDHPEYVQSIWGVSTAQ